MLRSDPTRFSIFLRQFDTLDLAIGAINVHDRRTSMQFDVMGRDDPIDEISRHRGIEILCANDEMNLTCVPGETHRSLARRVAAADEYNIAPLHKIGLN